MRLLDAIAGGSTLQDVIAGFLNNPATGKDCVKYPVMRAGASVRYTINLSGYEACMLDRVQMNSFYNEPRWLELKGSGIKLRSVDDG